DDDVVAFADARRLALILAAAALRKKSGNVLRGALGVAERNEEIGADGPRLCRQGCGDINVDGFMNENFVAAAIESEAGIDDHEAGLAIGLGMFDDLESANRAPAMEIVIVGAVLPNEELVLVLKFASSEELSGEIVDIVSGSGRARIAMN